MQVSDSDPRELVRKQFGRNAEHYVSSVAHVKGESLDRMLELLDPQPEWRALDIATGGGHTALALASRVREVIATDITPEMLRAAERFVRSRDVANVRFEEADAVALPYGDETFDLITCRIAPHHFPDCGRFVQEVARVLRPGGLFGLIDNVVPDNRSADRFVNSIERLRDPSHRRAYTVSEWKSFFEKARLEIRALEIFRKMLHFEQWSGIEGVTAELGEELWRMMEGATGAAREALAPELREGKRSFYLSEILAVGVRPLSSRS